MFGGESMGGGCLTDGKHSLFFLFFIISIVGHVHIGLMMPIRCVKTAEFC